MSMYCFIVICLYYSIINSCNGQCTKIEPNEHYNFNNVESDVDFYKMLLEPFKSFVPFYNTSTVPNYGEVIQQYQLGKDNPDVYLNITQLITKYGYPVEQHVATTEDKYCLTMFRIPKPEAPVVFLMHGVACSSDDWVTPGPRTGLAYALADAGYDVWLGNARGTKHGRCNLNVSPDCGEFWQFSFDESGLFDLPAMIDYTLQKTGKSKLIYAGHSQGTTSFFAMAAAKPEYNDKIQLMVALSAITYFSHVRSPLIQIFAPFVSDTGMIANALGLYELAPRDALLSAITSTFCGSPELAQIFCNDLIFAISGFNYPQANVTILPVLYGHYPAGASVRQAIHYSQGVITNKFLRYDYGNPLDNMNHYGTPEPPEYDLEKVTCPVAVFYGNNDWLTSAPDALRMMKTLPNVQSFYHVPCASYNHFDFLFAKDNDVLINNEVKRLLAIHAQK